MPLLVITMVWSGEQRGFAVRTFFENGRSFVATQRAFRLQFNLARHDTVPHRNFIANWVRTFEETGSTLRLRGSGRPKTARTPENLIRVSEAIVQSPTRSARKHSIALGISNRSVRRILHQDLFFHPYKIMIVQELIPLDYENRMNCSQEMLNRIHVRSTFFSSDEAHFHLSGAVNKQNFRYWAENNPRQIHERPLHSPKVTVWCAISKFGVIGPYFFEPQLEELMEEINMGDIWFQQDGATAHTARVSMTKLRQMFPTHLVFLRGDLRWPARSPDLSICDFFLWGYLKEKVFKHRPHTLEELKDRIREEIGAIPVEMCQNAAENFRNRLHQCIAAGGHHLSDVIFKS